VEDALPYGLFSGTIADYNCDSDIPGLKNFYVDFSAVPYTWTMLYSGGNIGKLVTKLKE
jgi:NADPH-dependent curcumin reductase CurA